MADRVEMRGINFSPIRILVTGFGRFPGVPQNPTERLVSSLTQQKARCVRLGVELHTCVLPATYSGAPEKMKALMSALRPHAVLHFGYAARRRAVCVETRALNRTSGLRPDSQGVTPPRGIVLQAPFVVRSALPCRVISASFRRAGLKSDVSIDSGDYVCNHIFFLSLTATNEHSAGFIHVPPLRHADRRRGALPNHRPNFETMAGAAFIAIVETARSLRVILSHAKDRSRLDPHPPGA